ncbi:hypothetical protein WA158_000864 [Blastocystis sp. Blastoise]
MFASRFLSKSVALNSINRIAPKTVGSLRFLNLHEYQSKELIAKYGATAQTGDVAFSSTRAEEIATGIWKQFPKAKFVVKAQVLAGGRGKGHFDSGLQGGVKLANT